VAAPAPTCTVHCVKPPLIVLLVTVAVKPLDTPAAAAVLPVDSVKLLAVTSCASRSGIDAAALSRRGRGVQYGYQCGISACSSEITHAEERE